MFYWEMLCKIKNFRFFIGLSTDQIHQTEKKNLAAILDINIVKIFLKSIETIVF